MGIKRVRAGLLLRFILLAATLSACRATPTPTALPVSIRLGGSDSMQWLAHDLATAYHQAHPNVTVSVTVSNSDNGLRDLARGSLDLALSSRPLRADDLNRRPVRVVEIARDAIVLVVHPDNTLAGMSRDQISKIYSGEIINWSSLKIEPPAGVEAIQLISREASSGTRSVFEELFLTGRRLSLTSLVLSSEHSVLYYVSTHPGALGYVSFDGWLNYSEGRVLAVDGVTPSLASIQDGTFPLIRPLYLVVPKDSSADLTAFAEWVTSPAGRAVISTRAATSKK